MREWENGSDIVSCGLNRMKHDFFKKIKITEKYPAAELNNI